MIDSGGIGGGLPAQDPTSLPGSNDPSQWAPDNSECKWSVR
ncbi:MAG: hypothetical protein ACLSGP_09530 [Faecalibacterium prausnitzii]